MTTTTKLFITFGLYGAIIAFMGIAVMAAPLWFPIFAKILKLEE